MAGRVPEVPEEPQTEKAVWQEQTVEPTKEEAAAKKKRCNTERTSIKRILRSRRPLLLESPARAPQSLFITERLSKIVLANTSVLESIKLVHRQACIPMSSMQNERR